MGFGVSKNLAIRKLGFGVSFWGLGFHFEVWGFSLWDLEFHFEVWGFILGLGFQDGVWSFKLGSGVSL